MKLRLLAISVALFVVAGPALAAPRQAQLADPPNEPHDIRVLQEFSRCAAHRWGGRARAILAMDYRTDDYRTRIRRFAREQFACAPNGMLRFGQVLFAGGMAEALLREQGALGDLAARIAHDPARAPLRARDQAEAASLCTVRAAPGEVAALFDTQPASGPEATALSALMPRVGACLTDGATMRVNRVSLRALLALAAYRLAEHNRSVETASAGPPR